MDLYEVVEWLNEFKEETEMSGYCRDLVKQAIVNLSRVFEELDNE